MEQEFISWKEVAVISGSILLLLVSVFISTIKLFVDSRYVTKKEHLKLEDRVEATEKSVTDVAISTVRHEEKISHINDLMERVEGTITEVKEKVEQTHDEIIKLSGAGNKSGAK